VGAKWRWPENLFKRVNPWHDPKPDFVIRQTGSIWGWTVPIPWVHLWWWTEDGWDEEGHFANYDYHPGRLYFGQKLFYVQPNGQVDPAGHNWARPDERAEFYGCLTASFRFGGKGP
jgi:hypothetical protein